MDNLYFLFYGIRIYYGDILFRISQYVTVAIWQFFTIIFPDLFYFLNSAQKPRDLDEVPNIKKTRIVSVFIPAPLNPF